MSGRRLAAAAAVMLGLLLLFGGSASAQSIVVQPASHNFGTVAVGNNQVFPFQATSQFPLGSVTCAAFGGNACSDYVMMPAVLTLNGFGDFENFTITFSPTATGTRNCTLRCSPGGMPPVDIQLTGVGTGPVMTLTPPALMFGGQRVSMGPSLPQSVTIGNTGSLPLNWSATVSGSGASAFILQGSTSGTVGPGGIAMLPIVFDPTAPITQTATLTVVGNDPAHPMLTTALSGVGTQAILSAPASLALGSAHFPMPPPVQTLAIQNTGTATVNVMTTAIMGPDANEFEFQSAGCAPQSCSQFTIAAGGQRALQMRCVPDSPGAKTAVVTIVGDLEAGMRTVNLTCNATASDINLTATTVAFGNVRVAQPATMMFSVQNTATGPAAETLTYSTTIAGPNAAAFSSVGGCTSGCSVAPGASATVMVRFTPTARQAHSATLTMTSNDFDEPSTTVILSGTGVAPVIGNVMPASQAIAFGNVDVGSSSTAQTASFTNTGDAPLAISTVTLTGPNANQFQIVAGMTGASTVAAGSPASWQVRCGPSSFGNKTAVLRVVHDAGGNHDVALTCTAMQAVLVPAPPSLSFGAVPVGQPTTLPVVITNTGNAPGTVQEISSNSAVYTFALAGAPLPRIVGPGMSITIDVTFTPTDGSVVNATLQVSSNATPAVLNIPLTGDGVQTGLDVSPSADNDGDFDFGAVCVGSPRDQLFTITNSGDTPVNIAGITLSGDASFMLTLVTPTTYPASIPGGGSVTVRVNAAPPVGGVTSELTITSDLATSPLRLAIAAEGLASGLGVSPVDGLDFGTLQPGTTSTAQSVIVTNCDPAPLTLSVVELAGNDAVEFILAAGPTAPPSVIVAQSDSVSWDVVFRPADGGEATAALHLAHDHAAGGGSIEVDLRGQGFQPVDAGPDAAGDPDGGPTAAVDQTSYYACSSGGPGTWLGALLTFALAWVAGTAWRRRRARAHDRAPAHELTSRG